MTAEELKQRFPRISDDCIRKTLAQDEAQRLNPRLYGPAAHKRAVENAEAEKAACDKRVAARLCAELQRTVPQALDGHTPKQTGRKKSSCLCHVLIVRYGRRKLDDDNLAASYKNLRDAVAAQLGIDDGDARIKFDYDQVVTKGETGTHLIVTAPKP